MRIFLTGATGYVGSAALDALVRAGHDVTAIVRNAEKAKRVASRGAKPVIGDLGDPASYKTAATGHDGYLHAAYEYSGRGHDVDQSVVETLASLVRGPRGSKGAGVGRCLLYTSGIWVLGRTTRPAAEDAPTNPIRLVDWRPAHERIVQEVTSGGGRGIVVRPGIVYGGSRGIIGDLLKDAHNGLIRVVGDGKNRWPMVYDRDLADLYARLVASPDASGVFHANDEADETVNDMVEAIAAHMTVRPEVRYIPLEEARAKQGPYADALALDQVVRSRRARALGWAPTLHSVARNVPRLVEEWRAGITSEHSV